MTAKEKFRLERRGKRLARAWEEAERRVNNRRVLSEMERDSGVTSALAVDAFSEWWKIPGVS